MKAKIPKSPRSFKGNGGEPHPTAGGDGQPATVRTIFDVAPGTYLVRLVVRDAEGQLMSAANAAVEIPY